jgi:hypothetical protein
MLDRQGMPEGRGRQSLQGRARDDLETGVDPRNTVLNTSTAVPPLAPCRYGDHFSSMSYSIWVADDPELQQVLADLEVVEPSDYPHFSTTGFGMHQLGEEMEAQGMFAFIPRWKFAFNDGEHVTPDEIAPALSVAQPEPQTIADDEGREFWRSWLDFLRVSLEHRGIRVF